MKITLIGPVYPYRGGIAHYTTSLALALRQAEHDVRIISFKRQYPSFLYPGKTDKDPSKNPIHINAEYLLDPLYPWTWQHTARSILSDTPDLIIIQWWVTFWGMAFGALLRLLRSPIKTAYLIHNVLPHENQIWDRSLARFALKPASSFIVQAVSQQERLLELLPNAEVHFCEHPVYGRFSEQTLSKAEARAQLNLPLDAPVFLFFGVVRPYKGLDYLLKALAKTDGTIQLIIAGEFWEDVSVYKEQIKRLGLSGRILLINQYIPDEQAHLVFSAADALVAPYVGGTQSGVVERANGYGLPIILTDAIVNESEDLLINAQVVPAKNEDALAAAINKVAKTPRPAPPQSRAKDDWRRMVKTIEGLLG
ncbi:MAG: glycosyltransferase [Anaerolineales bacterium]|nr:glycosyltransferase [Anaerolineales bacterium]